MPGVYISKRRKIDTKEEEYHLPCQICGCKELKDRRFICVMCKEVVCVVCIHAIFPEHFSSISWELPKMY